MKKNYQNPETFVVEVEMQPLMDVSNGGTNPTVSVSESDYDSSKGGVFSRGGGSWDDEE